MKKSLFSAKKGIVFSVSVIMVLCLVFTTLFGCGKENVDENSETTVISENDNNNTSEPENQKDESSVTKKKTDSAKKEKEKAAKTEKTTKKKKTYKSGTLASPMELSVSGSMSQSKSSVRFQSLYEFANGKIEFKEPKVRDNNISQMFSGDEEDAIYIAEYAERLVSECANFSMKEISYTDYADVNGGIFASWGINYTGSASVRKSAEQSFVDGDGICVIDIYYTTEYGKFKGGITWSRDLEATDFGMRCDGYIVDVTPGGESAGSGLSRTSDGKYKTSDNRLSSSLDKSSLIINGSKQNGTAVFEDTKYSDAIKIKNSSGNEIFRIFFPENYTPETGDVFYTEDLLTEYQWSNQEEGLTAVSVDEMRVYQKVNGKWITPTYNNSPYNEAFFRVMYYNASEGVAVFYLYTDTGEKTEMLCAVNLDNVISSSGSSGSSGGSVNIGSGSSGSGKCSHCQGKGYKTCLTCGGDGYYNVKIVTPNYAGSNNHHGTEYVKRSCTSYNCRSGKKDCPFC